MPPNAFAFDAVLALGTFPSFDSLISLPVLAQSPYETCQPCVCGTTDGPVAPAPTRSGSQGESWRSCRARWRSRDAAAQHTRLRMKGGWPDLFRKATRSKAGPPLCQAYQTSPGYAPTGVPVRTPTPRLLFAQATIP